MIAEFRSRPGTGAGQPATVTVTGEIDMSNADRFEKVMSQAAAGGHGFTVDLTRVAFMDSNAIRALIATSTPGMRIVVVAESLVAQLASLTGLYQVVEVVEVKPIP